MAFLKTEFRGDRGGLFLLALRTGFLTLVTAGIYRFWAKTRLRRWYWSATRPGGSPMEYTGTPLEKLTGFLFAIILLAIVLTAVNFFSITVSIGMMDDNPDAIFYAAGAFPILIMPLWYFARYRARRYILTRTRWRGLRFGMDRGSWGYAWRASMYSLLTVLSGGVLWPLMTFRLEKYLTDRTWYGNAKFSQHGSMWKLYGPLVPFLICVWGGIATCVVLAAHLDGAILRQTTPIWALIALPASIVGAMIFALYYRVSSIRILAALKELGDGVEFDLWPKTRRIFGIWFWGLLKTNFASGFVSSVVGGFVWAALWIFGGFDASQIQAMMMNPPVNVVITMTVLTYLLVALLFSVFKQTFITFPMVQHISETLEIHEPENLGYIRQRAAASQTDGGGFAEALDAGAAF